MVVNDSRVVRDGGFLHGGCTIRLILLPYKSLKIQHDFLMGSKRLQKGAPETFLLN